MKKCFKCGIMKSLDDFYPHPGMSDGHLNKCKLCARLDVRKNRRENLEHYSDYEKKRNRTNTRKSSEYRGRNLLKYSAQTELGNAVRDKKIVKQPCEICGHLKVQAHHGDYTKPLDVVWLCSKHHVWIHG